MTDYYIIAQIIIFISLFLQDMLLIYNQYELWVIFYKILMKRDHITAIYILLLFIIIKMAAVTVEMTQ